MKMYLLSDNVDTQRGMRLAGIDGTLVHEREETEKALLSVCADKEIGVLLITEKLALNFSDMLCTLSKTGESPDVPIPGLYFLRFLFDVLHCLPNLPVSRSTPDTMLDFLHIFLYIHKRFLHIPGMTLPAGSQGKTKHHFSSPDPV